MPQHWWFRFPRPHWSPPWLFRSLLYCPSLLAFLDPFAVLLSFALLRFGHQWPPFVVHSSFGRILRHVRNSLSLSPSPSLLLCCHRRALPAHSWAGRADLNEALEIKRGQLIPHLNLLAIAQIVYVSPCPIFTDDKYCKKMRVWRLVAWRLNWCLGTSASLASRNPFHHTGGFHPPWIESLRSLGNVQSMFSGCAYICVIVEGATHPPSALQLPSNSSLTKSAHVEWGWSNIRLPGDLPLS